MKRNTERTAHLFFLVKIFKSLGILFIVKLYAWVSTVDKLIQLYLKEKFIFEIGALECLHVILSLRTAKNLCPALKYSCLSA